MEANLFESHSKSSSSSNCVSGSACTCLQDKHTAPPHGVVLLRLPSSCSTSCLWSGFPAVRCHP